MNRAQLSKLFWAIKISLVVAVVYVAANAVVVPLRFRETFAPKKASGGEPVNRIDNAMPAPQAAPDYSVVANSGLFGNSKETPARIESVLPSERGQDARDTDLGLKLVGTIAGGSAASRAIIEDSRTRKTNPYKIGETIASATIESIERDKVVLRYHDRTRILLLSTDTTAPTVKPADTNEIRLPSAGSTAATIQETPSFSSGRLGQVETLFRQATIEPYVKKGQAQGLRITGLENMPVAAAFGLKNGDIIQSVNGQSLTSKQKAFQVLQKARTQSKVNMQLLRDGKVTDLSFNVR